MEKRQYIDIEDMSVEVLLSTDLIECFDTRLKTENTGPSLHYHRNTDHMFYIQDGKVEVAVGEQRVIATPGMAVIVPRLIPHEFHSIEGPARLIVTCIPGDGHKEYLFELSEFIKSGSSWDEGIVALQEKYDVHPPYNNIHP